MDDLLERAGELVRAQKHGQALPLYEEAIGLDPGGERGHCGAAVALMGLKRHGEAIARLESLARLRPGAAYPHGVMGGAMELSGRQREALSCYDRMIEIDPGEILARLRKAVILMEDEERYEECVIALIRAKPSSETALEYQSQIVAMLGTDMLYNDLRHMMPGMTDLRGAVFSPDSQDPARMVGRARSLSGKDRFAEAAEAADEAIAAAPRYWHAHFVKAMAMIRMDRYEESIGCLGDVLLLKPGDIDCLRIKGMLLERVGRPEGALECYDEIIRIEPGDIGVRYLKCGALASIKDAGALAECYRAALAAEPSDRKEARMQRLMREESAELSRCAEVAGSVRSGFAAFMEGFGVAAEPRWGRRGERTRSMSGERRRGRKASKRLRAGRRR